MNYPLLELSSRVIDPGYRITRSHRRVRSGSQVKGRDDNLDDKGQSKRPVILNLEVRLEKRSITISGHRTSLALEANFWSALAEVAADRGLSMTALIVEIDRLRGADNLASACRLAVLAHFRKSRDDGRTAPAPIVSPSSGQ